MMKDFIHKTLLNAGSKDAVSNMLQGSAVGAGGNVALGALQGDFDIVGNATSGALLGAGGGAALRHAGDKYASAISNMRSQGGELAKKAESFSTTHYTHAIKEESNFWGDEKMLERAAGLAPSTGTPAEKTAAAAGAQQPKAGQVNTGAKAGEKKEHLPAGTNLAEHQKSARETRKAMAAADEYKEYQNSLAKSELSNPSLANQKTSEEIVERNKQIATQNAVGRVQGGTPIASTATDVLSKGTVQAPQTMNPIAQGVSSAAQNSGPVKFPMNSSPLSKAMAAAGINIK